MAVKIYLGLRAVQASMTDDSLPGVTTITLRARYFSFYSWVLSEYGRHHPDGWSRRRFLRRRNSYLSSPTLLAKLTITITHSAWPVPINLRLTGALIVRRVTFRYRSKQCNHICLRRFGGFDAYRGAVHALGIMRVPDDAAATLHLLPKGQQLADAFATAIASTKYGRNPAAFDTSSTIPAEILMEYGDACSLDRLAEMPDRTHLQDLLLATDATVRLAPPDSGADTRGNMTGSMGMILDMIKQSSAPLDDTTFRTMIAYGLTADYTAYTAHDAFHPFVARWQMFQLREYYVYALYGLWAYFLRWLQAHGPQPFSAFVDHLAEEVHLGLVEDEFGLALGNRPLADLSIEEVVKPVLAQLDLGDTSWADQAKAFAAHSAGRCNEDAVYHYLTRSSLRAPEYVAGTVLLLIVLYIRLSGIRNQGDETLWQWAAVGGSTRCSLNQFVTRLEAQRESRQDLLTILADLLRENVISRHILVALEKWSDRKINTFHFSYDNGLFDWLRNGDTGFSASRFKQAYDMLHDLGFFTIDETTNLPYLTKMGQQALDQTTTACHG